HPPWAAARGGRARRAGSGSPVTGEPTMRDGENEAFIVDRYLESLLARRPADVTDLPPQLRSTAAALVEALPRYHPSFRFEESLAARLAGAADLVGAAAAAAGELIPFPATIGAPATLAAPGTPPPPVPDLRPGTIRRPTVIGGVLTSAAISLAGAAYVAWRRSRPPADPMARAIRAAARRRTA
ncbi:MAG: hypothetical protein QOI52_1324, partial [Chloroflexota bacterium]|nr:hypothetical protein [Chloroflexota bacterium]